MSNYYGQLPPQYANKYINNRMVNGYQRVANNSTPFVDNQLLQNNPAFFANIRDNSYYQKMNMEKMEKMRRIKNVDELGLSKDKLTNFIICPIKVEKESAEKLKKEYNQRDIAYVGFKDKDSAPKIVKDLWKGRKNNPWKNILKDEDYTKKFETEDDLVVHKVTQLDKNFIMTMAEFEEMIEFIEFHDGELRIKYSDAKENKYKEKFDYENKIKHRVKYDPKNYNELKKFYKHEQKKLKKANKRVDEMIEILLATENFTKEELEEINKPYEDDEKDANITLTFEKGDALLEEQLEKELAEEFGAENLEELLKEELGDNYKPKEKFKVREKINWKEGDREKARERIKEKERENEKLSKRKNKEKRKDSGSEDELPKKKAKPVVESSKLTTKPTTKSITKKESDHDITTQQNKKPLITVKSKKIKDVDNPKTDDTKEEQPTKKRITLVSKKDKQIEEAPKPETKQIGQVDDDEFAEFKNQQKKKKPN